MTDNLQPENRINEDYSEEEINLLDYWRVIWGWKFLIVLLVFITVLTTAIVSRNKIDIYQATAVISPIGGGQGGGSLSILSQQFGGLPGISLPASTSTSEIINLLKSNMLMEEMIERYNLLPVLFYERWDEEKTEWKGDTKGIPTAWDALRTLNGIVKINNNVKDNTITISTEFHDPEMAAKMVSYILATLTDHMTSEARRVANSKRRYLEEQLGKTADPLIRQKIYNLISQQIETAMMSELKEDFAFKVIDPPKVPDRKIKPNRSMMVKLSFVVSLFAGIFLSFFLEYVKRLRTKGINDLQ